MSSFRIGDLSTFSFDQSILATIPFGQTSFGVLLFLIRLTVDMANGTRRYASLTEEKLNAKKFAVVVMHRKSIASVSLSLTVNNIRVGFDVRWSLDRWNYSRRYFIPCQWSQKGDERWRTSAAVATRRFVNRRDQISAEIPHATSMKSVSSYARLLKGLNLVFDDLKNDELTRPKELLKREKSFPFHRSALIFDFAHWLKKLLKCHSMETCSLIDFYNQLSRRR